jgi:hypothetical protein
MKKHHFVKQKTQKTVNIVIIGGFADEKEKRKKEEGRKGEGRLPSVLTDG